MTWDGEERRRSDQSLVAVRAELASVRNALGDIVGGLATIAPRAEVEDMVKTERRDRYRVTMFLVGAIAMVMAFILFSVAQLSTIQRVAHQNRVVLRKIDCVIHVTATAVTPDATRAAYAECEKITAALENGESKE